MKTQKVALFIVLFFSTISLFGQQKWDFNLGFGTSLNLGNVNTCNINNDFSLKRNDSLIALDIHYKLLYSSLIYDKDLGRTWQETNFEVNGGVKLDFWQYGKYSPFLAYEMLTNKFKGYDLKNSGLIGMKYRIYSKPDVCDYSISAAFVFDWSDYTDETVLPKNNYRISIRPKIKQKITDNLTFYNCTFYQPSILDFQDFIINSETKLMTKITKSLYFDFCFIYEYNSRVPNETYKKSDFHTQISLRLKL